MDSISWSDFERVELRVGTVLSAEDFPEAKKPAYKLKIDFGSEIGIKQSSAQITTLYKKEELVGKQVVAVVNFPSKQVANFLSECLVTGFILDNGKDVVLLGPERKVPNGLKLL
jgi:tRNA-binding protein